MFQVSLAGHGSSRTVRRLCVCLAAGLVLAVAVPAASPGSATPVGAGTVYGGVTVQGWPVVIQLSRSGRQVARANIGIRPRTCKGR
jgi:hypothetical protein